jgi:hypothetical protein
VERSSTKICGIMAIMNIQYGFRKWHRYSYGKSFFAQCPGKKKQSFYLLEEFQSGISSDFKLLSNFSLFGSVQLAQLDWRVLLSQLTGSLSVLGGQGLNARINNFSNKCWRIRSVLTGFGFPDLIVVTKIFNFC